MVRRRTVSAGGSSGRMECAQLRDALEDFVARHDMLPGELAQAPHRHQLDETNMPFVLDREPREIHDLVVVDAAHDHDVDLDRAETGGLRRLRRSNGIEAEISAGDGGNAIRPETVGGDVDPIESRLAIELRDLG